MNNEVTPYPKYSYDSGVVRGERNEPVYGLDENWMIWQLNHGLSIMTLEEED